MSNKLPKDAEMSDLAIARGIIDGIWPLKSTPRKTVIGNAFEAVKRVERSLHPDVLRRRKRQWTERRIRSIVDQEIDGLYHFEVTDLEMMAMREARNEYRASVQRAARMAAFLQATDPDFHGPEIDRLREFFGSLDRA